MRRFLLVLFLIAGSLQAAQPLRRVALVYGNGEYSTILQAAREDARSIHDKLVELEFDKIILCVDCSKAEMDQALKSFKDELRTADQAFVYYSGHGAQFEQANYLLPARAPLLTPANIVQETFPVAAIYDALRTGKSKFNLIVLDACRNNPLLGVLDPTKKCGGWPCGLADPKRAPAGTIIAFATSPDRFADDIGPDGRHSPYTLSLLKHMGEAGLAIQDLFVRVHQDLARLAQVPWENTSQKVPFMFRDPAYVEITLNKADDEATVLLNGQSMNSSLDKERPRQLRLAPGTNILTLSLFNQQSRRGLVSLQEGWEYDVTVRNAKQSLITTLRDKEGCEEPTFKEVLQALPALQTDRRGNLPLPWDCLPRARFGNSFLSAAMRIELDRKTGKITFAVVEPNVWRDGFTLADNTTRDEIDLAIAWSVVRQSVRLFDDQLPGDFRPLSELRNDLASAHETSNRAQEESHRRAAALIRQSDDETLVNAIRSARYWELRERGDLTEGIRWATENSPDFAALRKTQVRNYAALRVAYQTAQKDDPRATYELALISNGELDALLGSN